MPGPYVHLSLVGAHLVEVGKDAHETNCSQETNGDHLVSKPPNFEVFGFLVASLGFYVKRHGDPLILWIRFPKDTILFLSPKARRFI